MATARTITEKILAATAGDVVVRDVDWVIGTDASSPMAIGYFEKMGGDRLFDPSKVVFSFDHYSPPTTPQTRAFHQRVRDFVRRYGGTIYDVGEGISHQVIVERGDVLTGQLVIGADSPTVTGGARNHFATGVGSSDLAAAMITGQIWLRVPETIRVNIVGDRPDHVTAKDVALAMVGMLGAEGANYVALEFTGHGLPSLSLEDRLVIANLAVETGAKAALFPADATMDAYLAARTPARGAPVAADEGARYARDLTIDLAALGPLVALPHAPDNVRSIDESVGQHVDMVFIGTCTGGRISDVHDALAVLRAGGSRIAASVHVVVTPASREVEQVLESDGTLETLRQMGATVTTPGCGACCGTSGVIPGEGATVLSTANRNFKARMGRASASIYLASPAACAAAAVTGRITDPRVILSP
jgi:3-isopropylmalate/(R)-2-methylmalate dehydratase large subunit